MGETALQRGMFGNVVLMPPENKLTGEVDGGLAFPEKFPDYARHQRGGKPCDVHSKRVCDIPKQLSGTYIWGGFVLHHFGHMMAEAFGRLWVMSEAGCEKLPILFIISDENPAIAPHLEAVLQAIGITDYVIEQEPLLVESLVIGEMGKQLRSGFHPQYLNWIESHNRSRFKADGFPEKICVLRSHLAAGKLVGEKALENIFEKAGYYVLRPEEHDLVDQFRFFFNAKMIVFTEGSAIHMYDLLPKQNAKIAVLNRRPLSRLAYTSLGAKTDDLHVLGAAVRVLSPRAKWAVGYNRALSYAPFDTLQNFLTEHEFVDREYFTPGWADDAAINDATDFMHFLAGQTNDGNNVMVKKGGAAKDKVSEEITSADPVARLLMGEVKEHFDLLRRVRFKFQMTRAQAALDFGDYQQAVSCAQAALDQFPRSALAGNLLAKAERRLRASTTVIGSLSERIRRAKRAFMGQNKLFEVDASEFENNE